MHLTGACLCGAIAYEISTDTNDVADYCHCAQCRRANGAPVVAWVQVSPDHFRVTAGQARAFASSSHAARWFCSACGSHLYMTDETGRSIGVTLGTLDNPGAVLPTVHGWESERIAWFELKDHLPRYSQAPPYD